MQLRQCDRDPSQEEIPKQPCDMAECHDASLVIWDDTESRSDVGATATWYLPAADGEVESDGCRWAPKRVLSPKDRQSLHSI